MNKYHDRCVHLEDEDDVTYWVHKLDITTHELNSAVLHTGSTNIEDIKLYLKKEKDYSLSFLKLFPLLKKISKTIHHG